MRVTPSIPTLALLLGLGSIVGAGSARAAEPAEAEQTAAEGSAAEASSAEGSAAAGASAAGGPDARGSAGDEASGILQDLPSSPVMVLPVESWGDIESHVPASLVARMIEGLERGKFTVVEATAVGAKIPTGACDPECVKGVVAGTEVSHLVRASVVVEGRDYNVRVDLFDADTGELSATSSDVCEICGHEELASLVGDLSATLRRKLSAAVDPPPLLRVLVEPEGSVVEVDGEIVGVTPIELTLAPGEHDVVVRRQGYVPHRSRLSLIDGVTETVSTQLAPLRISAPPPEVEGASGRKRTTLGWAAIGVGAGAAIGGVALLVLDERPIQSDCSGENVDMFGNCLYRYNTLAGGVAMLVGGVGALTVGALLVARSRRRGRTSDARATLRPGGAGMIVRF